MPAAERWEENSNAWQSSGEAAAEQKGVKVFLVAGRMCLCALCVLQKQCWQLLAVLTLPWSWRRSLMCCAAVPFIAVLYLGMICQCC